MAQRITNNMMVGNYNRNLARTSEEMYRFQTQLSTGRKIVRLSDDPVNTIKALSARARLADVEQYQRNLSDAKAWLTHTETALDEINEIVKRVYELSVQAANDPLSDDDRAALAKEIHQLRDQIFTISNTTLGDKFIFGGYDVTKAPFTCDPETGDFFYNGESMITDLVDESDWDHIRYETAISEEGGEFDVGVPPNKAFGLGKFNIYHVLWSLGSLLEGNTGEDALVPDGFIPDGYDSSLSGGNLLGDGVDDEATLSNEVIQPYLNHFLDLQKSLLAQMTEVGGRLARIELMEDRYSRDFINYTQMQSDVEDLDQAEAIMWFSMAEAVYRSSLAVGGRILPPTLVDFMK